MWNNRGNTFFYPTKLKNPNENQKEKRTPWMESLKRGEIVGARNGASFLYPRTSIDVPPW
jgi:hypothetical protein